MEKSPATTESEEQMMKAVHRTITALMPARRAASALPPIA
jgi:hypothetical protein